MLFHLNFLSFSEKYICFTIVVSPKNVGGKSTILRVAFSTIIYNRNYINQNI